MTYETIGAKLTELVGDVTGIANVFDRMPKSLNEYPCAAITAQGHENRFANTAANRRTYRFMIRLFYRTDVSQEAETILRKATDNIIAALESNVTLDGTCDFAMPTESRWDFVERESPLRVVEITIQAVTTVIRDV